MAQNQHSNQQLFSNYNYTLTAGQGPPQAKEPIAKGPAFDPAQPKGNGPLPDNPGRLPSPKVQPPRPINDSPTVRPAPAPKQGLPPAKPPSGKQPRCDIAYLTSNPIMYNPPGPSTETATDKTVKTTAINFLRKALTLADGTPNRNVPLGGFVRAAFHDAGTYNMTTGVGGANGSLRKETDRAEHRGLNRTLTTLEVGCDKMSLPLIYGLYLDAFLLENTHQISEHTPNAYNPHCITAAHAHPDQCIAPQ